MRDAHSSNRLKWRHWGIVLAIVLVGTTSVLTLWHVDHGVDQDCTVCQSRHQPAADFSKEGSSDHYGRRTRAGTAGSDPCLDRGRPQFWNPYPDSIRLVAPLLTAILEIRSRAVG